MKTCVVTVASYESIDAALSDWELMERVDPGGVALRDGWGSLLDAALFETDGDTVRTLHRSSQTGWAGGGTASAIVGILRPAAMLVGAVAGGVGETMLVAIGRGITRTDVKRLGEVLDMADFSIIAVTLAPQRSLHERFVSLPWKSAAAMASTNASFTEDDVTWALLADSAID